MGFQADEDVVRTLKSLGAALPGGPGIRLVLAGGSAGLIAGLLGADRVTADCDVILLRPEEMWIELEDAAEQVANEAELSPDWLSNSCRMFAWSLPLGWEQRCEPVGRFGRLDVWRLSRIDLIGAKVMSAPKRPQDVRDLVAIEPSAAELDDIEGHLDRLAAESLNGETFDEQRSVIEALRRTQ